jgi:hypothetical protein
MNNTNAYLQRGITVLVSGTAVATATLCYGLTHPTGGNTVYWATFLFAGTLIFIGIRFLNKSGALR